MTIGHPDYMSVANRNSGDLLPAGLLPLAPGIFNTSVLPVGQWDGIAFRLLPTGGQAVVTIFNYEDAAGLVGAGSDTWHVNAGNWLYLTYPTQSLFAKVQINNTGGVNVIGEAHLSLITGAGDLPVYPPRLTPIATTAAIVASGVARFAFGFTSKGWCNASINPHDNLGKLHVRAAKLDESGGVMQYTANFANPTALLQAQFIIPDDNWCIEITNEDAGGPHSVDVNAINLIAGT